MIMSSSHGMVCHRVLTNSTPRGLSYNSGLRAKRAYLRIIVNHSVINPLYTIGLRWKQALLLRLIKLYFHNSNTFVSSTSRTCISFMYQKKTLSELNVPWPWWPCDSSSLVQRSSVKNHPTTLFIYFCKVFVKSVTNGNKQNTLEHVLGHKSKVHPLRLQPARWPPYKRYIIMFLYCKSLIRHQIRMFWINSANLFQIHLIIRSMDLLLLRLAGLLELCPWVRSSSDPFLSMRMDAFCNTTSSRGRGSSCAVVSIDVMHPLLRIDSEADGFCNTTSSATVLIRGKKWKKTLLLRPHR